MSSWEFDNKQKTACAIVAHPDDETIFLGGTVLKYKKWRWKIVCMCFGNDDIRGIQFTKAINLYQRRGINITGINLGMEDYKGMFRDKLSDPKFDHNYQLWENKLKNLNLTADIFFTHNSKGEYGHSRHKALHVIVKKLYKNVWEFICPGTEKIVPQPLKQEVKIVPLSLQELSIKKEVFAKAYISEAYIWKDLPGVMQYEFNTGPEMFTSSG